MFEKTNILIAFYIILIFWYSYRCYLAQKTIYLSIFASFIFVTSYFVYLFFWLWMFVTLVTNPLNLNNWILYPLNSIIGVVGTIGGLYLALYFSRPYDNFKDHGKFNFKKNN